MMVPAHKSYRKGVGVVLINDQNKVFVAERLDSPGAWQMPQGGIDPGEEPIEAMQRELQEETSIPSEMIDILAQSVDWFHYDFPSQIRHKIMGGRYVGQEQKWFAARFMGDDALVNLATEHPEFTRWQWVLPQQVPKLIVPFKQPLYQKIMAEFSALLKG